MNKLFKVSVLILIIFNIIQVPGVIFAANTSSSKSATLKSANPSPSSSSSATPAPTCQSRKLANIKLNLTALLKNSIIRVKNQIDQKVSQAAVRYKRRFIDKGLTDADISLLLLQAKDKKTQIDSAQQAIIAGINSLDCKHLADQKDQLRIQFVDLTKVLIEYREIKKSLINKINAAKTTNNNP